MTAVVAPDYLWTYRCNLKGCCCNAGWRIGLVAEDLVRLESAARGTPLAARIAALSVSRPRSSFAGLIPTAPQRVRPEIGELPKDDAGHCAFIVDDGRCEIHRDLGESALPRVCQSFPVVAGNDGDVIRTTWELLCPEVTHALARSTTPAAIIPAPPGLQRAFIADAWSDAHADVAIIGLATSNSVPPAHEETRTDGEGAALFRSAIAEALRVAPDAPIAVLAGGVGVLRAWAGGTPLPDREALVADLTRPATDTARRIALLAVTEAARRRFLILARERERVERTLRLCRSFFQHHRWGTASTLDAVATAFASPDGPLARMDEDERTASDLFGPAERVIFANAAIAHQNLASPNEDSLLEGVARTLIILVDALFFRFLFARNDDGDGPTPAELTATAVAIADTHHRGKDAGADFFADLLRHLIRSPAVRALAAAAPSQAVDEGGLPSIGAVLLAELAHHRATTREAMGWYGRLVADWRERARLIEKGAILPANTPGFPVTEDAPPRVRALRRRAEQAIVGLGAALATDARLPSTALGAAALTSILPEFSAHELAQATRRLETLGLLVPPDDDDASPTVTGLDIATRLAPEMVGDVLAEEP